MSCGAISNTNHELKDPKKGYVWITWTPIPNLGDPFVKIIAEFAVQEYNKKYKKQWKCKGIQQGWYTVMENNQTQYRFHLQQDEVPEGDENIYEAVVSGSVQSHDLPFLLMNKNLILFMPYFNY